MTDTQLDLSLGEFRALVAKAGRGVGFTWGLADDLAYSAKRLAEFGAPSSTMVIRLLHRIDGVSLSRLMPDDTWQPDGDALCPICTGTSLADSYANDVETVSVDIGPVIEPALLVPLAATVLPSTEFVCSVSWDGGSYTLSAVGHEQVGALPTMPVPVTVRWGPQRSEALGHGEATPALRNHRVRLDVSVYEDLDRLAQRTYAPATDASRDAGAGPA